MEVKHARDTAKATWIEARIEFAAENLQCDSAGRLVEWPELLEAVAGLLAALVAQVGKSIGFAPRPYSTPGLYGIEMRVQSILQDHVADGQQEHVDPFHLLVDRLRAAWQKIRANSMSGSPKLLRDIGISNREFRTLKELSRFVALNVRPTLRTTDGRLSELPDVDPELLGRVNASDPEDQRVDADVTGVAFTSSGIVMLQLEFYRSVRAPYLSLKDVCAQLPNRPRAVGVVKCVDGTYEYQGEALTEDPQADAFR